MKAPKPKAATPPVTSSSLEVAEAGRQKQRQMQKRQGFASTLFAGASEVSQLLGGGR